MSPPGPIPDLTTRQYAPGQGKRQKIVASNRRMSHTATTGRICAIRPRQNGTRARQARHQPAPGGGSCRFPRPGSLSLRVPRLVSMTGARGSRGQRPEAQRGQPAVLAGFSPAAAEWFATTFPRAHRAPDRGLAPNRRRRPHPDPGPHRVGQDAHRLLLGSRSAHHPAPPRGQDPPHPDHLHLAPAGPGRRRGEEPAGPAAGGTAGGRAAGRAVLRAPGGPAHR